MAKPTDDLHPQITGVESEPDDEYPYHAPRGYEGAIRHGR